MFRVNFEELIKEVKDPDTIHSPVKPNAHETMRNWKYGKRVGKFWNIPAVKENGKWIDRENIENPMQPEEWKHWTGVRMISHRTGLEIGLHRKLSEAEKLEIVQNARTREDFHDLNKIMSAPSWGSCLCELRIISGEKCSNYLIKDKDGPEGKTPELGKKHWAWFIDPCPRAEMCPIAKQTHLEAESKGEALEYQGCDILIAKPTSEWVLEQHKDDSKGTIPGRVSTDLWLNSQCAACRGFYVNEDTNHLDEYQVYKFLRKPEHFLPKDWDPADNDWEDPNMPPAWPRDLAIQPCEFRPSVDNVYHPVLKPGQLHHLSALQQLWVEDEDIWLPGMEMTHQQYLDALNEKDEEKKQAIKDQQIEDSKIAIEKTEHEDRREKLLTKLVADQRGCDDSAEEDDDDD